MRRGRVGTAGTVFAEDINPQAIRYIDDRAKKEKLGNVRTVLGTPDDPKLPFDSVDAMLLLKVYHEIAHPVPVMKLLRASLRAGAKVGIIDRSGNGTDHGLDREIVEKEMGQAVTSCLRSMTSQRADGQDYFLIFAAR